METLRISAALGVAALVLSGCGADAEPKFEAEPSSTPTSASPTPDKPEAWEEKTPEGAVAFAERWTATFSDAYQTGETADLESQSSPTCTSCDFLVQTVQDIYADGGRATGDDWKLLRPATSPPSEDGKTITVTGLMNIPALRIYRPGEPVKKEAEIQTRFNFTLTWTDGWTIDRITRQS